MEQSHGPRAQDRNRVSRPDPSTLHRVDAAGQGLRQCRLFGGNPPGIAKQATGRSGHELCEAAADDPVTPAVRIVAPVAEVVVSPDAVEALAATDDAIQHDPVAGLEATAPVRGFDHGPGHLVPPDHRKGDRHVPGEYPAFGGADRGGPGPEDDLSRRRLESVEFPDRSLTDAGHDEGLHRGAHRKRPCQPRRTANLASAHLRRHYAVRAHESHVGTDTRRRNRVTGTPKVAFTLGAATRQAAYASSSGTAELVFSYTVRAGEIDTDGISWQANALTLAGGTVRLTTTDPNVEEDAALAHADGQSEHRVDADPPGLVAEVPLTMQGTVLELD